ncbi:MAG: T9SS type A sorting domain-containing protein [Ignavibacteria bacterium]
MKVLITFLTFLLVATVNAQWVGDNEGFLGGNVKGFAVINNKLFAGTDAFGGVYLHENSVTWVQKNNGLTNKQVNSIIAKDGKMYVGTTNGGVFVSTDEGESWVSKSITSTTSTIYSLGVNGQTIFAGSLNGIFISTNGGDSWSASTNGFPNSPVTSILVNGNEIFAATYGAGVYYSNDNGLSWVPKNNGISILALWAITSHNNLLIVGSNSGLYYSNDNGNSWNLFGIYNNRPFKSLLSYGNTMFAGKSEPASTNFLFSTNNGAIWQISSDGFTSSVYEIIAIGVNNGYVYVSTPGSGYRIHRRPLSEIVTSVESLDEIPTEFTLNQNYPNPFNPSTKISWQSPVSGYTTLKVYDVLGKEVGTLVNEYLNAGSYEVEFNAGQTRNLSSGVYLYKLQVGEFVQTKKMILAK